MKTRYWIVLGILLVALLATGLLIWEIMAPIQCEGEAASFDINAPILAHGWGVDLSNTRMQTAAHAGLTVQDIPRLKLKWAFRFPRFTNKVRSQPAVTADTVYVGSQWGQVYALNKNTGCVRWRYNAIGEVRTALTLGEIRRGLGRWLFFGDFFGYVHAVDATHGTRIWKTRMDSHLATTITGSPVLHGTRLYVPVSSYEVALPALPFYGCCTFRGSVVALDALTGRKLWQTYVAEPPQPQGRNAWFVRNWGPSGAPIWNAPTLDVKRGLLYVGTGENYSQPANHLSDAIIAMDLQTGQIRWSRQTTPDDAWNFGCALPGKFNCPANPGKDLDFGASPVLVTTQDGQDVLLAGQKSGVIYALNPDRQGAVIWQRRLGRGGALGGIHWGMTSDGQRIYVPVSDYLHELPGLDAPKPENPALPKMPGLYALDIKTGALIWGAPAQALCSNAEACYPGLSAAISSIPGVIFAGRLDGRLLAYRAEDGQILWQSDTTQPTQAVNGGIAQGGSIDDAGPVIAQGQLFMGSGYAIFSEQGGNAFLAYSVDGK